ncbi:hypothetical protein M758_6G075700 [Ceratodon purpureus]|nr:hypothetical protein M758_6G075700 [Ceratodon purpureus]
MQTTMCTPSSRRQRFFCELIVFRRVLGSQGDLRNPEAATNYFCSSTARACRRAVVMLEVAMRLAFRFVVCFLFSFYGVTL